MVNSNVDVDSMSREERREKHPEQLRETADDSDDGSGG